MEDEGAGVAVGLQGAVRRARLGLELAGWLSWGGVDTTTSSYTVRTRSTILTTMQPAVAGTKESPRHICILCLDLKFVQLGLAQLLHPWLTPLILIPMHI